MFINYVYSLFLVLLFSFSFSRENSCEELDSIISGWINKGELEVAYKISLKNIDKKSCNYNFYYNIGNTLKNFDDFNNARKAYRNALTNYDNNNTTQDFSSIEEYKKIKESNEKLSMLVTEISFIRSSYLSNQDTKKAIDYYMALIDGNKSWDQKEPYQDLNNNKKYDTNERFLDSNNNKIYDEGEKFTDSGYDNENQWITQDVCKFSIDTTISETPIEFCAPNPKWKDSYGNKVWDDKEPFTDWSFPNIGYLYLSIGDKYKRIGDFTNSIKYLKLALKQNLFIKDYKDQMNQVSKMIAKKGNNLLRLNKLEEAITQYELSLSVDTTESVIYYNLGNAYFKKKDYLNALNSYSMVLKLNPNKYKASYKSGVCYQKLDKHEEAVENFRNSIGIIESLNDIKSEQDKISFWSPYNELAISLMSLSLYQEANAVLNGIIDRSPNYYKAYEALGVLYSESTDSKYKVYDFALENFIQATKLKPNSYTIKFRLASLFNIIAEEEKENQNFKTMNKKLIEAKKYARQCLKLKKTHGGAYFELGVSELNLCNKSSGLKSLKKAAKYDRRYRSEVKRIIKKIGPIMDHCE